MNRRLLVSNDARVDIEEAASWLRRMSPTLPVRFGNELERAYSSIAEHPELYPLVYKNFRRALLHRFPYSVFYVWSADVILIVGVVHQSRDDSTWKRRA